MSSVDNLDIELNTYKEAMTDFDEDLQKKKKKQCNLNQSPCNPTKFWNLIDPLEG